jgi:hypothetical protein
MGFIILTVIAVLCMFESNKLKLKFKKIKLN